MRDYLKGHRTDIDKRRENEADRSLRLLYDELGRDPGEITDEMRRGYTKALAKLPCAPKLAFRLRAGAGLTYDRITAVCRCLNNADKEEGNGREELPVTISGVRRAYLKAIGLLCSPELWRYIEEGYTEAIKEDNITSQAAKIAAEDKIYELPKALQNALKRNGITSLDDQRLKDKKRKFSGIGPKNMSKIYAYMKMQ